METAEYEIMFRVEDSHWWYRALHTLVFTALETQLPHWREQAILDAGCGTGAILQRLGNPAQNIGVDLAPEALRFCQKRGLANVRQADIAALPFADHSFDAVICSSVLYHRWVPDMCAALAELRRVLRPGGCLFLNLPAHRFLHSAHDEAVFTERRFAAADVRKLLPPDQFAIRRLTHWTTLLFPLACLARTCGGSQTGRDFAAHRPTSAANRLMNQVMRLELALLRRMSLPFGVALFCVAQKTGEAGRVA